LTLGNDELLSNSAFGFNLPRYTAGEAAAAAWAAAAAKLAPRGGLWVASTR
jgi:hypothetical protein